MELPVVNLPANEYTRTATGNKIFTNAFIFGSQNIVINGKVSEEAKNRKRLSGFRQFL